MRLARIVLLAALSVLGTATISFAGEPPTAVPEPASLAVLATGIGILAIVKYMRAK